MWDIILECTRTAIIALILFFIWKIGKERSLNTQKGWGFILSGWSLILFGSFLDITDNFESLNWLIVVGDTEVESFLEKRSAEFTCKVSEDMPEYFPWWDEREFT